jgi:hypothetical protein
MIAMAADSRLSSASRSQSVGSPATSSALEVRFVSKKSWGRREAKGVRQLGEFHRREYDLQVNPLTEHTKDAGSITTAITYGCCDHVTTWVTKLLTRLGLEAQPKRIYFGTVELANQELIMNGDINYGVVGRLLELAAARKIPAEEAALKALLNPIAHDYLRLNDKLQELDRQKKT